MKASKLLPPKSADTKATIDKPTKSPLTFFDTELPSEAVSTHTLAVLTDSSIFALPNAVRNILISPFLRDHDVCTLVDDFVLAEVLGELQHARIANELGWQLDLLSVVSVSSAAGERTVEVVRAIEGSDQSEVLRLFVLGYFDCAVGIGI